MGTNASLYGKTSGGDWVAVQVDSSGVVQTSGSSGGTTAISGTVPISISSGTVAVSGTVSTAVLSGTVEAKPYTAPVSGAVVCGTVATQLPSVACKLVRFKARYNNSGTMFIGTSGVTVAGTVTDTTSGIPMLAGDDTGWVPIDNLNRLYIIAGGSPNVLTYLALN